MARMFAKLLCVVGLWGAVVEAGHAATPATDRYEGTCDASAAVPIGPSSFLVANDEDSTFRLYTFGRSQVEDDQLDATPFLQLDPNEKPEADLEGATMIASRAYWIGSHSANKEGKKRPNRRRLFVTDVRLDGGKLVLKEVPSAKAWTGLLEAAAKDPAYAKFGLDAAAKKAPEAPGGFNIEGLTSTPEGSLLIGLRNPLSDQKAIVIALLNPDEVLAGKVAKLGPPITLDLAGRGIRSLEYWPARSTYLIVAGPTGDDGSFDLYGWSGSPAEVPRAVSGIEFGDLHPEALLVSPYRSDQAYVVSDDGQLKMDADGHMAADGVDCKDLPISKRSFRALWVPVPAP